MRTHVVTLSAACALMMATPAAAQLQITTFVQGLSSPVGLVQDPSNAAVQFVVEQGGTVRVVVSGVLRSTPFLNLAASGQNLVLAGGERGLLGLAFPSDYGTTGRFYVNYTRRPDGHTVIARYKRSAGDPYLADPASRLDLEFAPGERYITQPASNHNGGKIAFGPDGYLYIGMGDGGGGGDQFATAQNPSSLLGKMLRIDVSVADGNAKGYQVPPDNPFLDGMPITALPEIWAFGYRNPWRFTFDPIALGGTGAMISGDVGQGAREEINYEPAGRGGRNYGWARREGLIQYDGSKPIAYSPLTDPIYDYPRSFGAAISGGYIYRGNVLGASHRGRYFFADYQFRKFASIALSIDGSGEASYVASSFVDHTAELGGEDALGYISSVDIDAQGELYLSSLGSGRIFKLVTPDTDGDGLPSGWETFFSLDPASAAGVNGASGDPDGDGKTNAQELAEGTHPRGVVANTRYLAEGATSAFFDTSFAVLNPGSTAAAVLFRFLRTDGTFVTQQVAVPANVRATVAAKSVPGLAAAEFSTVVETDAAVVVDRTMTWDGSGYGSHAESAVTAPATSWYFAEGATHSGFELFFLLQNSSATTTANVQARFLLPAGQPIVRTYSIAPNTRLNVWVDPLPGLGSTDVSAVFQSTNAVPIIVERAMYLTSGGQQFRAGHESAGTPSLATSWFLAEGATGPYFDEYILVSNPGTSTASVTVTYLRESGAPLAKTYSVAGNSRFNIWVDGETIGGVSLADVAVSASISSTQPVVVERSMWWPGTAATWAESHNSFGAKATGTRWALADGQLGGANNYETYVLIANTANTVGSVEVKILFDDGSAALTKTFAVSANARFNVPILSQFPTAAGKKFGVVVESKGASPVPIVVERAMYSDAGGVRWAAGTNALATKLQ